MVARSWQGGPVGREGGIVAVCPGAGLSGLHLREDMQKWTRFVKIFGAVRSVR